MRKFEQVKKDYMKFPNVKTQLPKRSDSASAGYDFYSKETFDILPGETYLTFTDVKACMPSCNVLEMYTRSGNGCKRGIILRNNVGIIDSSYYGNEDNDGNIGVCLYNGGTEKFHVDVGDRIAQGIFLRYFIAEDDNYENNEETKRTGGFGSSGR